MSDVTTREVYLYCDQTTVYVRGIVRRRKKKIKLASLLLLTAKHEAKYTYNKKKSSSIIFLFYPVVFIMQIFLLSGCFKYNDLIKII